MKRSPKLAVDRDALAKLIRPWAERLVTDIAGVLAPKIEALLAEATTDAIARLEAAFAPAPAVDEIAEPVAKLVRSPRKPAPPRTIIVDEIQPASVAVVHHGVKPMNAPAANVVHRDLKPENVIEADAAAPAGRTANGKAWPSCKLCGRVGVTARSHPLHGDKPATAASAPPKSEASAPPPITINRCHLGPVRANRGRSPCAPRGRRVMATTRKASPCLVS